VKPPYYSSLLLPPCLASLGGETPIIPPCVASLGGKPCIYLPLCLPGWETPVYTSLYASQVGINLPFSLLLCLPGGYKPLPLASLVP